MDSKKMMMYAGIALLVVVVSVLVWHFFFRPAAALNPSRGKEEAGNVSEGTQIENFSGSEDYQLLFFYANWCPHCKAAKPEMEKVNAELEKSPVNGKTVKLVEYDCTDPSPEMESIMDKYNVSSYPTLLLVSQDGKVTPFENKPTKDAVMNFLNANVK